VLKEDYRGEKFPKSPDNKALAIYVRQVMSLSTSSQKCQSGFNTKFRGHGINCQEGRVRKICVSEFVLIVLADLLPQPVQLFSGHVSIVLVRWLISTLYKKGTFACYKKSELSEKI
jgi:hypothetical protein